MKMKRKERNVYAPPVLAFTRMLLEDSIAVVASPVSSVTLDDWDNGGTNDTEDTGNIYFGL